MNPQHLRTFVAVAELRHFARAANACNLSQPAVSHQIALLESEVGAKLLNRAPRRVSLTVAGEVMLEEAHRVLAAIDRARERMQEVASGAVGRIRLGATATPGLYLLPPLLAEYRAAFPAYDLQFQVASADEIGERVIRNDLDMAVIAGRPATSELRTRTLVRDELVAISAPGSADRQCWILREETSTTRHELDAWLHRHRIVPARTMVFDGPDAVKRAVMAGLGIAVVSRLTVDEEIATGRLVTFDLGRALPRRTISVIDHPQKHHGAACSAMLRLLAARFSPPHSSQ
jgi:DNA-binding transcriptional LysR family regulator